MKAFSRNTKIVIGVIALMVLSLAAFFAMQRNTETVGSGYETEIARIGDITTSVEATGSVRAYQSAVFVWKTSGIVETVNVKLGDSVQKDDELAVLQKSSLSGNIIQAEASLIQAKQALEDLLGSSGTEAANAAIALSEAQEAYDDAVRYRELLDSEVEYDVFNGFRTISTPFGNFRIPRIETIRYYPDKEKKAEADQDVILQKALLDDAQRRYNNLKNGPAERDIAAAEANILAAQVVLDQAKIVSTFDGSITKVNTQVGDQVVAGEEAFRIDNLSSLLIDLGLSEIDINSVSTGQPVAVNFEAIGSKTYYGVVIDIAMASSPSTSGTKFNVVVALTDADELVRPGMTADVFIQVREVKNALLIPNQAIRILNGERVVYLLKNDETLEPALILLGARSGTYSEVVGGELQAGDMIVLNPPSNINVTN